VQIFRKQLSVFRLPKAHVLHVLQDQYERPQQGLQTSQEIIKLSHVVRRIEQNVFALSKQHGEPFATAILIAPDLILTARHCVEKQHIPSIYLREGYELTDCGLSYGANIPLAYVVEENAELDYAIVKISQRLVCDEDFISVWLAYTTSYTGSSVFIHYPNGNPKMVSVHEVVQSDYQQLGFSGFHDSWKGSSGGGYFNEEGQLIGLHTLYRDITTGGVWLKNILDVSAVLQCLNKPPPYPLPKIKFLAATPNSESEYHEKKLNTKILRLPALPYLISPAGTRYDQARHHIIPDGDMQFLWLIGQECSKLGTMLTQLSYQCSGSKTINAMEWAPWNIFIGVLPEDRLDNPHDDGQEKIDQ
jgi:hypothetical protein